MEPVHPRLMNAVYGVDSNSRRRRVRPSSFIREDSLLVQPPKNNRTQHDIPEVWAITGVPPPQASEVFVSGQVGDRVSSDQQDGSFDSFQALETLF